MRHDPKNVITTAGSFQLTVLAQRRVTRLGYVGQVVNLRRIGNPPGGGSHALGFVLTVGRRVANPPQIDNLPHKNNFGPTE